MNKIIFLLTFFIVIATLTPVFADSSDESGMFFNIIHETKSQYKLINSTLMECQDKDCTVMNPLATGIMPGGFCEDVYNGPNVWRNCFYASFTLNHSAYYKVILSYSDKIKESNAFQSPSKDGGFNIIVRDSDLLVENNPSARSMNENNLPQFDTIPFIISLTITIILELLVGYAFVRKIKNYKRIIISIVIANLISVPIVWLVMTYAEVSLQTISLILSEAFAMIFETFFIYLINRKLISFKRTLIMSITMNLVSFLIGSFMLALVASYFQII